MSLSEVRLPGALIADLYKQTLVQQADSAREAQEAPAARPAVMGPQEKPAFLGNNGKHICIVVDFEEETFLPDHHLQFLTKMLEACRLNLGDVAIVNHAPKPVNMDKLRESLHPQYTLLFGVEPVAVGLPLNFPQFKEQAFAGCTYVHAPALGHLNQEGEEGKLLKTKLWACLKKLFNI